MTHHVIAPLVEKYRRLAGDAKKMEKEAEELSGDDLKDKIVEVFNRQKKIYEKMRSITTTIRMYDPEWTGERLKPINTIKRQLPNGSVAKAVLKTLATAESPLTTTEITDRVIQLLMEAGLTPSSKPILRANVDGALRRRLGDCVARHDGHPFRWSFIRKAKVTA